MCYLHLWCKIPWMYNVFALLVAQSTDNSASPLSNNRIDKQCSHNGRILDAAPKQLKTKKTPPPQLPHENDYKTGAQGSPPVTMDHIGTHTYTDRKKPTEVTIYNSSPLTTSETTCESESFTTNTHAKTLLCT